MEILSQKASMLWDGKPFWVKGSNHTQIVWVTDNSHSCTGDPLHLVTPVKNSHLIQIWRLVSPLYGHLQTKIPHCALPQRPILGSIPPLEHRGMIQMYINIKQYKSRKEIK